MAWRILVQEPAGWTWSDGSEAADAAEFLQPGIRGCSLEHIPGRENVAVIVFPRFPRLGDTCYVENIV